MVISCPFTTDDASLSASKSGTLNGLARLASKFSLAAGTVGVFLAFAFRSYGTAWRRGTCLAVLRFEGLAHAFLDVVVVAHGISVARTCAQRVLRRFTARYSAGSAYSAQPSRRRTAQPA